MTALLVACGALAREVVDARDRNRWDARVLALPALLHNTPAAIPVAVERRIDRAGAEFAPVIVVYGDCGTGGALDRLLRARGWLGLAGPHCYAAFAGERAFDELMRDEPGTFFLTDYLVGSFDHLVIEGLGLDRYPELRDDYFGRYRRAVYLRQRRDPALLHKAEAAAAALGLPLEIRHTGTNRLEHEIGRLLSSAPAPVSRSVQLEPRMPGAASPEGAPRLRAPTAADNPASPAPVTAALEGTS